MDIVTIVRGILGVVLVLGIAFLFSNNKRKISWRLVISGMLLQIIFAMLIIYGDTFHSWLFPLKIPKLIIDWVGQAFITLLGCVQEGSKFVFGNLALNPGAQGSMGFFFAFQVLPTIIFFAGFSAVLYYTGILQFIVKCMAYVTARIMGTSGAESLSNTASIFMGQTEAPLLIKPYIAGMTNSELFSIMVSGMAHISGGVMISYVQMLGQATADAQKIPLDQAQLQFAVYLLTACVMATPASLVIAKIMFPETGDPQTKGTVKVKIETDASNVIEAAANGTGDGVKLAINVGGMLIVFIAFITLINILLGQAGNVLHINDTLKTNFGYPLSLELILGLIFKYIAIGIGVPVQDSLTFGSLFGVKTVLNEFVAYIKLADVIRAGTMTTKGIVMSSFALCGFANFSSIAIQLGGIAPMAPDRKKDIAAFGFKAVLAGALSTLLTATLAGILLS